MDLVARTGGVADVILRFPGKRNSCCDVVISKAQEEALEEVIAKDMSTSGAHGIPGASDLRISNLCTSSKVYVRRNQYNDFSMFRAKIHPPTSVRIPTDSKPWTDSRQ